jgi:coenzyme F420-reducing hydrogenase delta subunit
MDELPVFYCVWVPYSDEDETDGCWQRYPNLESAIAVVRADGRVRDVYVMRAVSKIQVSVTPSVGAELPLEQ